MIEEIKNIKSTKTDLRKFGNIVGIALALLGVILYLLQFRSFNNFFDLGLLFIFLGTALPVLLLPIHKIWMTFAIGLGFVMTRVILTVLFFFVVAPIGLIAKLAGKDFLNLKNEKKKESYWNLRESEYQKTNSERQF